MEEQDLGKRPTFEFNDSKGSYCSFQLQLFLPTSVVNWSKKTNASSVEENHLPKPIQVKPSTGEATNIDIQPIKDVLRSQDLPLPSRTTVLGRSDEHSMKDRSGQRMTSI